jgi:hypothetical protein
MNLTNGAASQRLWIEECEELFGRCSQILSDDPGNGACGDRGNFVLQFREFRAIGVGQQIATGRKYLAELDEHGSEFFACAAKVLRTRLVSGLMFDQFIVGNANAVTREYSQDFAVTLALRDHGASTRFAGLYSY